MQKKITYKQSVQLGQSGLPDDIDRLMSYLSPEMPMLTIKLIDNALNLVDTKEGKNRLRFYLFKGSEMQRNYAALYFKRRGIMDIVREAYANGLVDEKQAFLT